jgi:hypothetical protein
VTVIIKRKQAKDKGLLRYFTGNPCLPFGHISERATRNGECLECAKARLDEWRKKNPEKRAKHRRVHAQRHPERERQQRKDWIASHPEKHEELRINKNKATSIWAKNNLDKKSASASKRRASQMNATPNWLTQSDYFEMDCIYKYCSALRSIGLDYEVDHIIPLQGKMVSGMHVPWNLQVITQYENQSKGNRL